MSTARLDPERKEFLRCIRDLNALSALQGVGTTARDSEIVESFAAALIALLDAELIYVRLPDAEDGGPVEHLRTSLGPAGGMLPDVRQTLRSWLPESGLAPPGTVAHPFGAGRLQVAATRFGTGMTGVIIAGSSDPGFPDLWQSFLLDLGSRQATISLGSRAVRDRDHRSSELVARSPDFISFADLERHTIHINPAGLRLVGLASTDRLAGLTVLDLVAEADQARFETRAWPGVMGGGNWSGEIALCHFAGGPDVPVHIDIFGIGETGAGRPRQIAMVGRDRRASMALEVELRRLNDDLEVRVAGGTVDLADANDRLRREMSQCASTTAQLREAQAELIYAFRLSGAAQAAASFARELSEPLTAVTLLLEAAGRLLGGTRPDSVELARDAIGQASETVLRANAAVFRMRGFVRHGRVERTLESVRSIVDAVVARAAVGPGADHLTVEIEIDPAAAHARIDALQIQQVLLNLVRNALESMDDESPRELTIRVGRLSPGTLDFEVIDRGAGVPPEIAGPMFEPFVSTKPGRMGLGLSMSRSIVEGHGGAMRFEPNPGGGAMFAFTVGVDEGAD